MKDLFHKALDIIEDARYCSNSEAVQKNFQEHLRSLGAIGEQLKEAKLYFGTLYCNLVASSHLAYIKAHTAIREGNTLRDKSNSDPTLPPNFEERMKLARDSQESIRSIKENLEKLEILVYPRLLKQ